MIQYRTFRNTDPPGLLSIWNDAFLGRGAVHLKTATPLDFFVLSKPYFDPAGLLLAFDDAVPVGFAHAGFIANTEGSALSTATGVICAIAVRPQHRNKGIGSELLRRSEEYLTQRGARTLIAGSRAPANPFYFGLLGGSDSPGALTSEPSAEPFFLHRGYALALATRVLHRALPRQALIVADPRFAALRSRFEVRDVLRAGIVNWWQECVLGPIEMMEFRLEEKKTHELAAVVGVWEMQGFSQRWSQTAVGIKDLVVRPDMRRKGLGRFLVASMLKQAQEQYFNLVEVQVPESNAAGFALFRGLGFEPVDTGKTYTKEVAN